MLTKSEREEQVKEEEGLVLNVIGKKGLKKEGLNDS